MTKIRELWFAVDYLVYLEYLLSVGEDEIKKIGRLGGLDRVKYDLGVQKIRVKTLANDAPL